MSFEPGKDLETRLIATVHLRIYQREENPRVQRGVLGIDAPTDPARLTRNAHILYEQVGDESLSGLAHAFVTAHLIRIVVCATT